MDTSSSTPSPGGFGFLLRKLHEDDEPEAKELAEECERVISELCRRLKPCFKYVSKPYKVGDREFSTTELLVGPIARYCGASNSFIYISRDGQFRAYEITGKFFEQIVRCDLVWHDAKYDELLIGLERILNEAEIKREANLRSLREKRLLVVMVLQGLGITNQPVQISPNAEHTCDLDTRRLPWNLRMGDCPGCVSERAKLVGHTCEHPLDSGIDCGDCPACKKSEKAAFVKDCYPGIEHTCEHPRIGGIDCPACEIIRHD